MSSGSGSDCKLPSTVMHILMDYGAWLVGSGVPWFLGKGKLPKDLDLIVNPCVWSRVMRSLPGRVTFNKFGGCTFEDEGWIVDIWPSNLDDYYRNVGYKTPLYAMSLNPYIVVERNLDV